MRTESGRLRAGILILTGCSLVFLASACGGSSDDPSPTATAVQPAAAPTVAPAATAVADPTATPEPASEPVPAAAAGSADSDILAQGKLIFEETAGGVGCAFCHGMEGRGDGPADVGAPANRGATKDRLKWALGGGETDAMTFIKLTSTEIDAVVAYLQFLGEQP